MKPTKFAVAAAGLIGLVAIFLAYVPEVGMSFWDLRPIAAGQVYIALVGFLGAAVMGGLALVRQSFPRWQAIVTTLFFALAILPGGVREGFQGAIGGKLMLLSAAIGLLVAIVGIVVPERRTLA